ncbi:MAG: acyltransferase [Bifidobacteriaceae bacterium]|jgi:peptidoglycan/LPS O-acetylase OafA/YrhL|nr:acyltransferase [Bifidobacteriaceae bacterium]
MAQPKQVRLEIQALRAVAVMGVVLFHLWPGLVRGGYVGVDVFFVISGFLITGGLLRELRDSGRISFSRFYARRIRRLLPAALLVLVATGLVIWFCVPQGQWGQDAREAIGSALYVENWLLAADSVDYLAAQNDPSPMQHYWSLSVEEQFYIVWPLLLFLAALVVRRRGGPARQKALLGVLVGVFVLSLALSVWQTYKGTASIAYFATYTRAFEFALGGLVAAGVFKTPPAKVARPVALAGWALVGATIMLYTEATAFPGIAALVPSLGAALVIWAGLPERSWWFMGWQKWRLVQTLGDISYSLYLWHWPLIVTEPFWGPISSNANHERLIRLGLLAAGVVLSLLSYHFVENPVRHCAPLVRSRPWTYSLGAAAMALVCGLSVLTAATADRRTARSQELTEQLLAQMPACLGAAAVMGDNPDGCVNPELDKVLVPSLAARGDDIADIYSTACYDGTHEADPPTCHYGVPADTEGALRVAITGDSHAATLGYGLRFQYEAQGWSVDTYFGSGCVWSAGRDRTECTARRDALQALFESGRYDLIIQTSARGYAHELGPDDPAEALAEAWAPVAANGTKIVAIVDDPWLPDRMDTCIKRANNKAALQGCNMTPADAFAIAEPYARAAELSGPGVASVDLTEAYCQDGNCPAVIGGVNVYRDQHHITATYSRTLAPFAIDRIKAAAGL